MEFKKLKRTITSLFLSASMLIGMLPATAMAAEASSVAEGAERQTPIYDIIYRDKDFSSERLLVKANDESKLLKDNGVVLGNIDDMYLVQYASEKETMDAYTRYKIKSPDAYIDGTVQLASDKDVTADAEDIVMTEDDNPFAAASNVIGNTKKAKIALIDTGVTDTSIERYSTIGDVEGKNTHGDDMLFFIKAEDPDASVASIKALNDDGIGTVSDVYAAIEMAIDMDVDYINLSLYAKSTKDNECVADLIKEAEKKGITVVGAAGNEGDIASSYVPGKVKEATIVGSVTYKGTIREFSNFGKTVDYYIPSDSTSEAAARMTGILSAEKDLNELEDNHIVYTEAKQVDPQIEDEAENELEHEVIRTNVYRPMSDLYNGNWKNVSDKTINEYYWNNSDLNIYKFLESLSQEERDEFLERNTLFKNDERILTEEWQNKGKNIYEQLKHDFADDNDSFKAAEATPKTKSGFFYVDYYYGSNYKCYKVNVTLDSLWLGSGQYTTQSVSSYSGSWNDVAMTCVTREPLVADWNGYYYYVKSCLYYYQPAYTVTSSSLTNPTGYQFGFKGTGSGWTSVADSASSNTSRRQVGFDFFSSIMNCGIGTSNNPEVGNGRITIRFTPIQIYIYYNMNGGTPIYDSNIGTGVGAYQNWSNGSTRRGYYQVQNYNDAHGLGAANALFRKDYYHINPENAYTRTQIWHQGQTPYTQSSGTYKQWNASGSPTYTPHQLSPMTTGNNWTYYGVILNTNWVPNTITVLYDANGGTIADAPHHGWDTNWFKLNGNTVMRSVNGANGTYNQATTTVSYNNNVDPLDTTTTIGLSKAGYHINTSQMWRQGSTSGTIRNNNTNSWTDVAGNAGKTSANQNITFYANWIPNVLTINYYANGATNSASTSRANLGDLPAGITNNSTPLATSKGDYDTPKMTNTDSSQSLAGVYFYTYNRGLPNADPVGSSWDLTKPGYVATNYWHVGSPNGPLIDANKPYNSMQELAADLGVDLSTGNRTVNLYADLKPLPSTLYIHYVDEDGNEIMQDDTLEGVTDKEYDTRPAIIDGYTLFELPDNISGKMKATKTEVTYVYRKATFADIPQIEKENQVLREVKLFDESEKIKIKINKTDQTGTSKLEGAVFQVKALTDIYDQNGELLFEKDGIITYGTTNAQGELDFGTMFPTNKYADKTQYRAAGNYMYEVTEVSAPEGCEKSNEVFRVDAKPSSSEAIATFSYNVKNTVKDYITVKKRWVDGTIINRKTVYVDVYNGSTLVKSNVKLDEGNDWTAELEDVPRTNGGTPIQYRFVEKTVNSGTAQSVPNGYKYVGQTYNQTTGVGTITNVSTRNTSAEANKIWQDNNDHDKIRPSSVNVDLYQVNIDDPSDYTLYDQNYETKTISNDTDSDVEMDMFWSIVSTDEDAGTTTYKIYKPYVLSEANNWHVSVGNLPLTREDGTVVTYKFEERVTETVSGDARSGYSVSSEQSISSSTTPMQTTTITNKHDEIPTKARVVKIWNDSNIAATKPDKIQVNLLANGEVYNSQDVHNPLNLKASDGWSLEIDNLPRFINGEEVQYSFEEIIPEDGYEGKLLNGVDVNWTLADTVTVGNTTKIINSFTRSEPNSAVTVNKIWNDTLSGEDAAGREKPVFNLKGYDKNDTLVVEKSSADDPEEDNWVIINDRVWQYKFTNLPATCKYSIITEEAYDGYDTTTDAGETNTCTVISGEEATFINTETEKQNFSVEKITTGDTAEQTRLFDFAADITGLEKNKKYNVMYTPYYEDGTRYSFVIPGVLNDSEQFKVAFDLYEDESTGRVEGTDITSVAEIKDIDTNVYDEVFEIQTVGETTWRGKLHERTVFSEIDIYHLAGEDINDIGNWVVDLWYEDELLVEKQPLIAGDSIRTENLASLREQNIRYDNFTSDGNGKATIAFQLQHGEKFTIQEIPVNATAKVDEDIEGLTYTNKFEYYDDNTPVTEYDNDTDGVINITEDTLNPTVRCTNISNLKRDFHLKKIVTGNVGSRDRKFPFRINIENLAKHTSYDVVVKHGDESEETYSVTSTINGTLSLRTKLAHGEELIIKEIPSKAVCTTYEDTRLLENYKQTWNYQYEDRDEVEHELAEEEFSEENGVTIDKEAQHGNIIEPEIVCTINADQDVPTLICTNNAETIIPTGLTSDHWKVMIIIVIAIGAGLVFIARRKTKAPKAI